MEVEQLNETCSWSRMTEVERIDRQQFEEAVTGRSMRYAPITHYKNFCQDMKQGSGRLMDFNKGMVSTLSGNHNQ
jgi:hypothetical protein